MRLLLSSILLLFVVGFTDCYKPTGSADGLPKHIRTIAIPAFQNGSLRFKVEQRFTSALTSEVLQRTRSLRVVSSPEEADAVVLGTIKHFSFNPVLVNDAGRARLFSIAVTVAVTVRDQTTNKIIYQNQDFIVKGEYEISGDPDTYFNEEAPAVDRLAKDFAKSLCTAVLEGF